MTTTTSAPNSRLPLVVHVAFAGKRRLLPAITVPSVDEGKFHAELEAELTERLRCLPDELGLMPGDQICAMSSLARGGDLVFTRACRALGWRQRILLPQAREDFLRASEESSSELGDFTAAEANEVRTLLKGKMVVEGPSVNTTACPSSNNPTGTQLHLIEERVVSTSGDRDTRFEDVNLEMLRACDVLIGLLPAEPGESKPAGTEATMALAQRRSIPVLELRVAVSAIGNPMLSEKWQGLKDPETAQPPKLTPTLPEPLNAIDCVTCGLNDTRGYRRTLLDFADKTANHRQTVFRWAALAIVGAHVMATALALLALKADTKPLLIWLLSAELMFLAAGLSYHWWLHHSHAVRHWAMARLSAQIASSVSALAQARCTLEYLLDLPMPLSLRPLLRTLNVLHLQDLRMPQQPWQDRRTAYVQSRLRNPDQGQLAYYQAKLKQARRWLSLARWGFYLSSIGAFTATGLKLSMKFSTWHLAATFDPAVSLGFLAVLLPVIAVAGLSLAAAFDLEAREHIYDETLKFLEQQTRLLDAAVSENEFSTLAVETERRLLGETANWYARRAFTGIA